MTYTLEMHTNDLFINNVERPAMLADAIEVHAAQMLSEPVKDLLYDIRSLDEDAITAYRDELIEAMASDLASGEVNDDALDRFETACDESSDMALYRLHKLYFGGEKSAEKLAELVNRVAEKSYNAWLESERRYAEEASCGY